MQSLVLALDCAYLTTKKIKTYVVSDLTCPSSKMGTTLTTVELNLDPYLGSYKIWYDSLSNHQSETILFEKSFIVIGKVSRATLNTVFDNNLTLSINNSSITIPGDNTRNQEKNIDIVNNLKRGENLASFSVYNKLNTSGYLRFRIEIEQEVLV